MYSYYTIHYLLIRYELSRYCLLLIILNTSSTSIEVFWNLAEKTNRYDSSIIFSTYKLI